LGSDVLQAVEALIITDHDGTDVLVPRQNRIRYFVSLR
jgi:hypothetical protein